MLVQHSLVDPLMSLNWGPMDLELPDPATGSREVRQCIGLVKLVRSGVPNTTFDWSRQLL